MNCRISGELFESRTVKIKRGHARPEASFLRAHLPKLVKPPGVRRSNALEVTRWSTDPSQPVMVAVAGRH
jgi:hypothetical protein